jgi:hypothetical protein
MEDVVPYLVAGWLARITTKMKAHMSSRATFIGDSDFNASEMDWMQRAVIPELEKSGLVCHFAMYKNKGSTCEYCATVCDQCKTGVKFVAALK